METFSLKPRKLILSDAAVLDILEQASWYREKEGSALALRWERALTLSLLQLTSNPLIGALCRFKAPELQGIRRLSVRGFPKYLVFYRTLRFCALSMAQEIWKVCYNRLFLQIPGSLLPFFMLRNCVSP